MRRSVPDGPAQKAFREANEKNLAAIADYEKWLREEFRPKAVGKFAIGAAAYPRMLADDDMVDLPLPRLESIGEAELARLLASFETTARAIDPTRSPADVFEGLSKTHPAATEVLASVSAGLSLNNRLNSDKVRTLFYSGANAERWALYCEQMMLDEGLHAGEPRYRLAQIQAALQRACRYLVGIRMHTKGMTIEEAQSFFAKNAFMTTNNARVEAMRGTQDPGYLRYQLGKLMILKLRDDLKAKEGTSFVLGRFHDAFLREGAVPILLIRRALLGSDGPLL